MVASNVDGVLVKGAGHWLMEEALDQVMAKLLEFLDRYDGTQEIRTSHL